MVIGIEGSLPSQLCIPPCIGPFVTPSHIAVELGFVSSISSSGRVPGEFIDHTPLSFVDDLLPIISALPLYSLKPLDVLPG